MQPPPDEQEPPPSDFWTRAHGRRFGAALLAGPALFLASGLMSQVVPPLGVVLFWTAWGATLVGSGVCASISTRRLPRPWHAPACVLAALGFFLLSLVLSYPGCALAFRNFRD